MTVRWLAESLEHDQIVFRIGRNGDQLIAEWEGIGTLTVRRDATGSTFRAEAHADPAVIAKLKTGTLRALLRHLRSELTLHAAAVTAGNGAVALVGDSGAGKSTLAFALATTATLPFELLSDDCLCLDDNVALPSEAWGWLDDGARRALQLSVGRGKSAALPRRIATRAVPLRAIVHLVFADGFHVRPLRGSAAAAVLGRSMIRFVLDEPGVHRADMDRLADLARSVNVVELGRPRAIEHLGRTAAMIEELTSAW